MFTASPSPSIIASTRQALKTLKARPELRRKLWDNAHHLYQELQALGFQVGPEPSPVVAVRVANIDQAVALWKGLLENGIYVNLVTPPRLRTGGVCCAAASAPDTAPNRSNRLAGHLRTSAKRFRPFRQLDVIFLLA
jgi:8-amino-7-oxononanoate synthase